MAEATPSIKRVVSTALTSSIQAFDRLLVKHFANYAIIFEEGDDVPELTAETKVPTQPVVLDEAQGFQRYINSKIAAANFVHEYEATGKLPISAL